VLPGEAFCANCGASLLQAPIAPEPVAEAAPPPGPEPIGPSTPHPAPSDGAAPGSEPPAPPLDVSAPPPEVGAEAIIVPPPPVAEPEPPAAAVQPPVPAVKCPVCGTPADPDDTFCSTCGAALKQVSTGAPAPAPAPAPAQPVSSVAPSAAAGRPRLVVDTSGAEIPLPPGSELLIGREDPVSGIFPDVDMTPHGGEEGGVSRRHARLLVSNGQYAIEDLDSTNYTFVNRQKIAPHTRQPLRDGDEIRLGRVGLVLRLA
jgi:uncharacterized Zn finger protein (UPF0148 family)